MQLRLSEEQARFAAKLAEDAKVMMGLTNVDIAKKAGYVEKTVRGVLAGQCYVHKTVSEVCDALGIDLDSELKKSHLDEESNSGGVSRTLGGYSKSIYGRLVGSYTTIRPAYSDLSRIKCYRTVIEWDPGFSCLRFTETERYDAYGHRGQIYIPPSSNFMYLMTIDNGWIRTVLVSQLLSHSQFMRGIILSQFNISGANYAPVCAPIIYMREKADGEAIPYGEIGRENSHYKQYARLLWETISRNFVKVAMPSASQLGMIDDDPDSRSVAT